MNINAGGAGGACASTPCMNNGQKDKTASDVQKLQEQLNDIKEQVHKFQKFRQNAHNQIFKHLDFFNIFPLF